VSRNLLALGWSWPRIADWLRVAGRTLRHWCRDVLGRIAPGRPRGRPAVRSPRDARNTVIARLDECGPGVGLPTLRAGFPTMRRAELADLLTRYRRAWRARHREPLRILTWPVLGRVWAVDFAEPPAPLDGRFGYLLAVRDLASGMPLLWQPVEIATAVEAAVAIAGLFAEHGPPLVLKTDKGSPFTGDAFRAVLAARRVQHLLSPPYWPRYNGAIEAGIHALKDRTAARAARAGHADRWTLDDVAAARVEAAELPRPRGPAGPSPAAAWQSRHPVTAEERRVFADRVQVRFACGGTVHEICSPAEMARTAVRRALEECGYLQYRRRRIPPPIPGRKVARIM
jgi:transposase InsO family protein